jgi:hypothetical protein
MGTPAMNKDRANFIDGAFDTGVIAERQRILKVLEALPFRWDGDKQTLLIDKQELLKAVTE